MENFRQRYQRFVLSLNLSKDLKDIVKKTHSIRHSNAQHLQEKGAPLETIQVKLGHKRAATTQIYLNKTVNQAMKSYGEVMKKSRDEGTALNFVAFDALKPQNTQPAV